MRRSECKRKTADFYRNWRRRKAMQERIDKTKSEEERLMRHE